MFSDQSDNRKKQEVTTLAKWLVSIPSVSTTKGESIIMHAILNGINDFNYFKNRKDNIFVINHDDGINTSVIALVLASNPTPDTTIMLCNPDTSNLENYGSLKPFAFRSDDMIRKLATLNVSKAVQNDLNDNNVFGLGIFESKAACAAFLVTLKNYSDRPELLKHNMVFVCTSSTINENKGIKATLPYLDEISKRYNLKYKLAINIKPNLENDPNYHVFSKSVGHICPCFYVVGKTDQHNPFKNFSSSLLASKLIEELELNPNVTNSISKYNSYPTLETFHTKRSRSNPHEILLKFKLNFFNLDPNDLINMLKMKCVDAFNKTACILDDREAMYCQQKHTEFDLDLIDAEVVTYSELFARAAKSYQGDLSSAIETMSAKAREDGIKRDDIICRIFDRLVDLAKLARPSIIIFLSEDFIPQQNIFEQIPQERETILEIGKVLQTLSTRKEYPIVFDDRPYASQDISFLRPTAADSAIEALGAQCPFSSNPFYNLHVPIFTVGIFGHDMNLPSERVSKDTFVFLIDFIDMIMSNQATLEESLDTDRSFTASRIDTLPETMPDTHEDQYPERKPEVAASTASARALNDNLFKFSKDNKESDGPKVSNT